MSNALSWPITASGAAKAAHWLNQAPKDGSWVIIFSKAQKDRSAAQNALNWSWVTDYAQHTGSTKEEAHNSLKLRFGCPILIRDSAVFATFYKNVLQPLPHDEQEDAMQFIEVTRLFTVAQMTEYLEELEQYFRVNEVKLRAHESYERAMG